jgi:hypothetical protein
LLFDELQGLWIGIDSIDMALFPYRSCKSERGIASSSSDVGYPRPNCGFGTSKLRFGLFFGSEAFRLNVLA